ncbi:MAG TPA: methyltransferase domain-containing protein [Mycobacterium sp.]
MIDELAKAEPTGERFVPEDMGGGLIEAEHQARYRLALPHVAGRTALDAGCGVGWGSDLLLDAGAREVTGLDLSPDAIASARSRDSGVTFLTGDLLELPFAGESFDVVVCFEALEHTSDTARTLDELVRVLRPGGLLFVSSPNPAVYPAGNPFHLHELPPEELRHEVARRLPHVALLRQHLMLSSLLCPESEAPQSAGSLDSAIYSVAPVQPGHDPYSLVVASTAELPAIGSMQALAPSDQLDHLGTLSAALSEERVLLRADHQRIVDERTELLSSLAEARLWASQLAEARSADELRSAELGSRVGELAERNSELAEHLRRVENARADATSALAETPDRVAALPDSERLLRRQRDRFAADLVGSEQALARTQRALDRALSSLSDSEAVLREDRDRARNDLAVRQNEIDALRGTVSWRVTTPLRRVRTIIGRRGPGRGRGRQA